MYNKKIGSDLMIYTDLTKKAMKIMFDAHKDQKDKSDLPYVFHPFLVANNLDDEYSVSFIRVDV